MLKRRGKSFNQLYRNPLPVTLSVEKFGQLPPVTAHNPVSWLFFAWRLLYIYSHLPPQEPPVKVEMTLLGTVKDAVFSVSDENGMMRLWRLGFFGKGTLSRSEPSWKARTEQRLGVGVLETTSEEVTSRRRSERNAFKSVRHKAHKLEEIARLRALTAEEQKRYEELLAEMETMRLKKDAAEKENLLTEHSAELASVNGRPNTTKEQAENRSEPRSPKTATSEMLKTDANLLDPELELNLETLQLQKTEVFFLQFALQAVQVMEHGRAILLEGLFLSCLGSLRSSAGKFLLHYVVYHHYRSLGWCPRSGLKFGCDMILYKRGPPMLHAEYAVLVVPEGDCGWVEWQDFMALARVVGGVRKTLVLAFVLTPSNEELEKILLAKIERNSLTQLFTRYKVTEIVYKRWSPSLTRD